MRDDTPRYDIANLSLKDWARWSKEENKLQDIGYPKQTAFMNDGTGAGFITDVPPDQNVLLVEKVLRTQPTLHQVAQSTYIFNTKCSITEKAIRFYKNTGIWLGSTDNTRRVTYKAYEVQLVAFVAGAFATLDDEID